MAQGMRPTIEDAKRLQRSLDLGSIHLVYFGEDGFTIAHTDYERHRAECMKYASESVSSVLAQTCDMHKLLVDMEECPVDQVGWYKGFSTPKQYEFYPLYGKCHCGSIQPHLSGPECNA